MTSYRAINGFYIIKTIAGSYFVGLSDEEYNKIHMNDNEIWINSNIMIPLSSVDYYMERIPCKEFIKICENAGIRNREDVKEALMDFNDKMEMHPIILNYMRYMNDLRCYNHFSE